MRGALAKPLKIPKKPLSVFGLQGTRWHPRARCRFWIHWRKRRVERKSDTKIQETTVVILYIMESSLTPGCCWVRKICLLSIALSLFATTTTLTYAKPITISRESSVNRVIKSNSLPSNYYHNNNNDNSKSALSRNLLKECIEAYLGNIQVSTDDFEFLPMVSIHADASSTSPLSASHKNTDIFTLLDAIPNVPKKSILSTLSSRQKLVQPGTGSGSFSMAYLKFLREYVGLGIALHGEDGEKMLLEASQSVKEKEKKMKNLEAKIKREYDAYLQGLNESNDTKTVDFSEWSQSQTDYQIAKNVS